MGILHLVNRSIFAIDYISSANVAITMRITAESAASAYARSLHAPPQYVVHVFRGNRLRMNLKIVSDVRFIYIDMCLEPQKPFKIELVPRISS